MRGFLAATPKVAGGIHNAPTEMPLPQAIDNHAAGQRVIRVSDPFGERSAALALGHVVIAKIGLQPLYPAQCSG